MARIEGDLDQVKKDKKEYDDELKQLTSDYKEAKELITNELEELNSKLSSIKTLGANKKKEIDFIEKGTLYLLVENMGRVNYGPKLRDRKGISAVRMGYQYHFGWDVYCLTMEEELSGLDFKPMTQSAVNMPSFFRGCFHIDGEPADTFLRLDGFHKGFVKINGVNIGRYFNDAGPQKTLFVPAPFLKSGKNEILIFESDRAEASTVEFFSCPDLG